MAENTRETPFTVTQVTNSVKEVLEETIGNVWVKGEISNYSAPSSGHLYFTLKDEVNQIKVAFFRGRGTAVSKDLKDGREVIVNGRVSIYGKRSEYQLIAREVMVLGAGDLLVQFEKLKKKLSDEGLFDEGRKRKIPRFPERIAIITSGTGAAIRDILNIISRRYRSADILLCPVMVQGDEAAPQIIGALKQVNERADSDVIIITRGGGSIEDLWAFNDEKLAREIYSSKTPVISAVGHEIDFTIADFAADLRAPTPSAAAELVVPERGELVKELISLRHRLSGALSSAVEIYGQRIDNLVKSYGFRVPFELYNEYVQRVDDSSLDMVKMMKQYLEDKEEGLKILSEKLSILSPLNTLKKGYSVVYDDKGNIVKDAKKVRKGSKISVRLHKGKLDAETR